MSLIIDGKAYEAIGPTEIELSADGVAIHPMFPGGAPLMKTVNRCECCGRGDLRCVVYHSIAEAVADGFLREVR